jgi:hypothetical protein
MPGIALDVQAMMLRGVSKKDIMSRLRLSPYMLAKLLNGGGQLKQHCRVGTARQRFAVLTPQARQTIDDFLAAATATFPLVHLQRHLTNTVHHAFSLPLLRRYLKSVKGMSYKRARQQYHLTNSVRCLGQRQLGASMFL